MKINSKIIQAKCISKIGKFFINKLPHAGIAQGEEIDFASQIQGKRFALMLSILEKIENDCPCYFSSGSFGDHVLHCSIIKSAIKNDALKRCKIIYDEKYDLLYGSYFSDVSNVKLMPVVGYIASSIDSYFINAAEWLKGYSPIIPLLPIYYPILPFMVEYNQTVSHPQVIASILGIKYSDEFSIPANYDDLCRHASSKIEKIFKGSKNYIVIAPSANSIGTIPVEFWAQLVNSIPSSQNIIVNVPDEYQNYFKNSNVHVMHFEPHLAIAFVDNAQCLISAPSGLANMAKIFTSTKQLLICDYRNSDFTERVGLTSKVPVELQHNQYMNKVSADFKYIGYKSDHLISDYIGEVLSFI